MLNVMTGNYKSMTESELNSVPVTDRGNRSQRWQGIQHGELISAFRTVFEDVGLTPINERYYMSPSQATVVGGFDIGRDDGDVVIPGLPQRTVHSFGFLHDNSSKHALRCTAGGTVSICSNGMVSGMSTWKHKHTSGLNLLPFLRHHVTAYASNMMDTERLFRSFTKHTVSRDVFDEALLCLGREGILPWRLLGLVDRHWENPEDNPNFAGDTVWDWYNTVNEVAKKLSAMDQFPALAKTSSLAQRFLGATAA